MSRKVIRLYLNIYSSLQSIKKINIGILTRLICEADILVNVLRTSTEIIDCIYDGFLYFS